MEVDCSRFITVDFACVSNEVHFIIDGGILTYATLKLASIISPTVEHSSISRHANFVLDRIRRRVGAYLGDDAIEVVVALRDSDKASYLAHAIAATPNDRDARS